MFFTMCKFIDEKSGQVGITLMYSVVSVEWVTVMNVFSWNSMI